MTSVVSICNLALSSLGKDEISSLTEASAEARACNQFYTISRDTLLQSYPWRFATKTQSLGEISNDKAGAWSYAYARPVDCLKVLWLRPAYSNDAAPVDEFGSPYEIEGRRIYCNLSPAFMRYITREIDVAHFPPLFVDALASALAVRLAMPMTRSPKIRADAYQFAKLARADAEVADANEIRETSDIESEQSTVRAQ
jgi:hypothetical protein